MLALWLTLAIGCGCAVLGFAQLPPGPAVGSAPEDGLVPAATTSPALPGPPAVPLRLQLPDLGVDAAVVPVTVGPDGQLGVPDDSRAAGWWPDGAAPGSAHGTVVIDGHVDSQADGPGALFRLAALRPGAEITLVTSSATARYVLVALRSYSKNELPAGVFDTEGAPRLVLITCGGAFDHHSRQYADNIVAYAVPAAGA